MKSDFISREDLETALRLLTRPNRLVCLVCAVTGLRVGDVLSFKTDSFRQRMTVREAKTGKPKRIYIPKALFEAVRAQAGRVWVFEGGRDSAKHRTRQAVWWDLKRAARAFRFRQNVSVHSIRKLYAAQLQDAGYSVDEIQKELNHSSPEITLIYLLARMDYERRLETGAGGCLKAPARKRRTGPKQHRAKTKNVPKKQH